MKFLVQNGTRKGHDTCYRCKSKLVPEWKYHYLARRSQKRGYYCYKCMGFTLSRYGLIKVQEPIYYWESFWESYYNDLAYRWIEGELETPND